MKESLQPGQEFEQLFPEIDHKQYFRRYHEVKLKAGEVGANEWRAFCDTARITRVKLIERHRANNPELIAPIEAILGIPLAVQREGQRYGYQREKEKAIEQIKQEKRRNTYSGKISDHPDYRHWHEQILQLNEQDARWQQVVRQMIIDNKNHPKLDEIMEKFYNTLADIFYNRYETLPDEAADQFMISHRIGIYAPIVVKYLLSEYGFGLDEVTQEDDVYNGIDHLGYRGQTTFGLQIKGSRNPKAGFKVELLSGLRHLPTEATPEHERKRFYNQEHFIDGCKNVSKRLNRRIHPIWVDVSGFMDKDGKPINYSGKPTPELYTLSRNDKNLLDIIEKTGGG